MSIEVECALACGRPPRPSHAPHPTRSPNPPRYLFTTQEGICHDFENSPRIAKLLYYESSRLPPGETTSFDEYISRCDPEQVRADGRTRGWFDC